MYGLGLDVQAEQRHTDWGPQLVGQLLATATDARSALNCTGATWVGYLNPDLDYHPEYQHQNLTIPVNATHAMNLNWDFIATEAQALFGIAIDVGTRGLPVLTMDRPAGVSDAVAGRLNHDQLYVQDQDGNLAYRQQSVYQIELYPSDNPELFFLHEFGHSLGLGHIDRDGQIMAHRENHMAYRIHECHADWLHHLAPTTWRHTWP